MKRRFFNLLSRYAFIKSQLESETKVAHPSTIRLVRLRRLQHQLRTTLQRFVTQNAIRRASRPRLPFVMPQPQLVPIRVTKRNVANVHYLRHHRGDLD